MARIDLSPTYEEYLRKQVEAGLFRSITAAAEHAIYSQMMEEEKIRQNSIMGALLKGEEGIEAGRTIPFTNDLMSKVSEEAVKYAKSGKPIKREIRR